MNENRIIGAVDIGGAKVVVMVGEIIDEGRSLNIIGMGQSTAMGVRKGEIIGEHEVTFSSGKEVITLNHEAFDRALYSEGAFTAAKWLMNKKPGLYSMRDVLKLNG